MYLLIRELLPSSPGSVAAMLEDLGVGKSQCYELKERLREVLAGVLQSPGRPPATIEQDAGSDVTKACYDYVTRNPGSVCVNRSRRRYSPDFRGFVVDLVAPGGQAEGMCLENLSRATGVPLGTLKDWLAIPPKDNPKAKEALAEEAAQVGDGPETADPDRALTCALDCVRDARCKTIITQWPSWKGTFQAFCQAMFLEFAIPFSSTLIGNILQAMGLRDRKPRASNEVPGSRGAFRTDFPGAQWLGDGTTIAIYLNGRRHVFNIEALLDIASNAMVGIAVTDVEDAEALGLAKEASLVTTHGVLPWAVTLDNKACNTCAAAVDALEDAVVLYGHPGRGQSKAALEGAFGLFMQSLPSLDISGDSEREVARSALRIILTAWHRGRNGRPRKRLKGRTPLQVFLEDGPTPEQVADLKEWLAELLRRQDAARLTREARLDPVRIGLLRKGLAELGIPDPEDSLAKAMACFSRDSIMMGIAIFKSKRDQDTLPQESHNDGAYLRGIISRQHTRMELEQIEVYLMEQRIWARDLALEPLTRIENELRSQISAEQLAQGKLVKEFLKRALKARYSIDFLFWTKATTNAFLALPSNNKRVLYKALVRRVSADSRADGDRRADLIDRLATCLVNSSISAAA